MFLSLHHLAIISDNTSEILLIGSSFSRNLSNWLKLFEDIFWIIWCVNIFPLRDEDLKIQIALKLVTFGSPANFPRFPRITSINFRFNYFCRLISATFLTDVGWTEKIRQYTFSRLPTGFNSFSRWRSKQKC